jgi:hypothetical protein
MTCDLAESDSCSHPWFNDLDKSAL